MPDDKKPLEGLSLIPIAEDKPATKKSFSQQSSGQDDSDNEDETGRLSFFELPVVRQLGLLIAIIVAGIMIYSRFQNPYKPVGSDPRAAAQIRALNAAHEKPDTDMAQLRVLLEAGNYSEVERVLRELQDNVNRDISWESTYQTTFENISYKSDFSLPSIERWVESTGSPLAYLARGSYYMAQGNKERGAKAAYETSDDQFTTQGSLHAKGVSDVQRALAMDPALLQGYSLLIMASDSRGISIVPDDVLQKAIAVAPGGYYYRYQYLRTRMPKWGGSFKAMKAFTDSQERYLRDNPRIWLLNGFADAEQARSAERNRNYREAVKYYSEALQYGIHPDWLTHRAYCLSQIREYEKALNDVNLSLEYLEDSYARQLQRSLEMQ